MYEVSIRTHFSSAHNLRGYKGKCEALHGHNWQVEIAVSAESLDETGMVVDFKDLKAWAESIMDRLDHTYINEVPPFDEVNPSSENLARYIFDEIEEFVDKVDTRKVSYVKVWESSGSCATYSGRKSV